jgi:hypothetical protein
MLTKIERKIGDIITTQHGHQFEITRVYPFGTVDAKPIAGGRSVRITGLPIYDRVPEAGDETRCEDCGAALVYVRHRGLWLCDLGTRHRHACMRRRVGQ